MMMTLGHAYAISGRAGEAQELLAQLVGLSKQKYVPTVYMMGIAAGLDDKDAAFHWLNQAVEDRCDYVVYLLQEPGLDNLRSALRRGDEADRPDPVKTGSSVMQNLVG